MTMTCWGSVTAAARQLALAALLTGASTSTLTAQGETGTLRGHVRDTAGRPLCNARVTIVGTSFSTPTDSTGSYRIEKVPPGTFSIRATYAGYVATEIQGMRSLAGQTLQRDFVLKPAPSTLKIVEMSPGRA